MRFPHHLALAWLVAIGALAPGAAVIDGHAAGTCTINYTGPAAGDLGIPGNWTDVTPQGTQRLPAAGDTACIAPGLGALTLASASVTVDAVDSDSDITVSGGRLALTGSATSSATKNVSVTAGTLEVATSAPLTVTGTLTAGAQATVAVDLGDTAPGGPHAIKVSGAVSLDGTLALTTTRTEVTGDHLPVLRGASIAGTFAGLAAGGPAAGQFWSPTYGATTVGVDVLDHEPTVTTLSSSATQVDYPTAATLTLTASVRQLVAGSTANPTGTVQLATASGPVGAPVAVDGGGTAVITGVSPPDPHSGSPSLAFTATYSGDSSNAPSTSSAVTVTSRQRVLITLPSGGGANPPHTAAGSGYALTVTVDLPVHLTAPQPVSVRVTDGSAQPPTVLLTTTVGPSGSPIQLALPDLSAGVHALLVSADADANYQGTASAAELDVTASLNQPLSFSGIPQLRIPAGFPYSLTATLTGACNAGTSGCSTPSPTGVVDFYDTAVAPGTLIASVPLTPGAPGTSNAIWPSGRTRIADIGAHSIRAVYQGDTVYDVAGSTPDVPLTVERALAAIDLAVTPATEEAGRPSVAVARVSPVLPATTQPPSGNVEFSADGVVLGTASVDSAGTAAFLLQTPLDSVGPHVVAARYLGDGAYQPTAAVSTADAVTSPAATGYWLVAADGGIFRFGAAPGLGSAGGVRLTSRVVGMAPTPDGRGYWLVAADGGVFPFGTATGYGSTGGIRLNSPIVAMVPTSDGGGYWLVAADGGVFPFGDATGHGSTGGVHLNAPVVGMAATPDGGGYWLVAADGGIFPFGDAPGLGSTGGIRLTRPVVGMTATVTGNGYWLVASDGGVFPFGDALGLGSTGGRHLNSPIAGMAVSPSGRGYWLVAGDGGVFPFGDAPGLGSTGGIRLNAPIVSMASSFNVLPLRRSAG